MCMIFGFSANKKYNIMPVLRAFYKHSEVHNDGWGLAYYDSKMEVIKEPIKAVDSNVLKNMRRLDVNLCIAHIRKATQGKVDQRNTHPFTRKISDLEWSFIHNGSIGEEAFLEKQLSFDLFKCSEKKIELNVQGDTDSEKIFELMNQKIAHLDSEQLQFQVLDSYVAEMAKFGKLNLIISNGQNLYVHTNLRGSLWMYKKSGLVLFSTRILDHVEECKNWRPVPLNKLMVYRDGELVFEGNRHSYEHTRNKLLVGENCDGHDFK